MSTKTENLGSFEGEDVLIAQVAIRAAGDGLSKALAVHPTLLHRGDKVFVVLECEVKKIAFSGIKDTDTLARIHDLTTLNATLIDEAAVRAALDATKKAIEEANGISTLPYGQTVDPDEADDPESNGEAARPAKATRTRKAAPAAVPEPGA
jgi:hypothetical protein